MDPTTRRNYRLGDVDHPAGPEALISLLETAAAGGQFDPQLPFNRRFVEIVQGIYRAQRLTVDAEQWERVQGHRREFESKHETAIKG